MPLSQRWTQLRPHKLQRAYWTSKHRFNMLPCGRRSGKTELFKRKLINRACAGTEFPNARFFAAAPTLTQAIQIYWQDLKALTPRFMLAGPPSESHHIIKLINDSEIHIIGMDKPERIEGQPWDGGGLDEYGNMKERAWSANVRPALSDRLGWCDFLGVPEGRNHYFDLYEKALAEQAEFGDKSSWAVFQWESKDILPASEIEAARRDLHPLMFAQEFGGAFISFNGVAIFDLDRWMPVQPLPTICDTIVAVIDTAVKDGKDNDSTAVIYAAVSRHTGHPLVILDWDIIQIEGALLETWLPTVFQNCDRLAQQCGARFGSAGAFIEDKVSGSVLIQQARKKGWKARALPSELTAMGKDERALSVSGYHYAGKCSITQAAYDKKVMNKGQLRNHLVKQVSDFRIGDPDAAKRADDVLDVYVYLLAITFGDNKGQ